MVWNKHKTYVVATYTYDSDEEKYTPQLYLRDLCDRGYDLVAIPVLATKYAGELAANLALSKADKRFFETSVRFKLFQI